MGCRLKSALCPITLVFLVAHAVAVEEKALPAFSVTRNDGAQITSIALTEENQYLLMYVAPSCRPCDSLLAALNDPESPELPKRVVIIVRGDLAHSAKYVQEHLPPEAETATWYADASEEAYRALKLDGTPYLLGVRNGRVVWSINGVMKDSTMVRAVMRKWTK